MRVQNPVVRGFYPDPSICSANGKYYLACSSFEYFPGVPLFESDDLLNWKPIGHCLTRKSQVNLYQVPGSGGVFAPTIRFHNGRFYMVTNNNTYQKNFYVYTDDIYSEWSDPVLWIRAVLIRLCILKETKFILSAMERMNQMEEAVFSSVRSISQPENV